MAEKGSDSVGTASVEIIGHLVLDEASVAEAEAKLQSSLEADVQPKGGRGRGRGAARDAAPVAANVDAKIKTKLEGNVRAEVQKALDSDWFQINIDTPDLRSQIQKALQSPFKIVIDAEVRGVGQAAHEQRQSITPSTGTAAAAVGGATRGPVPENVHAQLKKFGDTIDHLHDALTDAYTAMGRSFGTGSNPAEKLLDILGATGATSASDLLSGRGKSLKGALSPAKLKELGIPEEHIPGIVNFAGQFRTTGEGGASPTRDADVLFKRLTSWAQENPVQTQVQDQRPASSAGEVKAVLQAVTQAVRETSADLPSHEDFMKMLREGDTQRAAGLRAIPFDPAKKGPAPIGLTPGAKPFGTSDNIDADRRAMSELRFDRANIRKLARQVPNAKVAGLDVSINGLLRAASMGTFNNIFEMFGGKGANTSMGLTEISPEDAGSEELLKEISKRRGKQVVPGLKLPEGVTKVQKLNSREAFTRSLISMLGVGTGAGAGDQSAVIEAIRAFIDDPAVSQQVSTALGRGASPLKGASGATKRGQGGIKLMGGGTIGDVAKRVYGVMDRIDRDVYNFSNTLAQIDHDISRLSASGQDVSGLQDQRADLNKALSGLLSQRSAGQKYLDTLMGQGDPAEMRALAEAQKRANAENQARLAAGRGAGAREGYGTDLRDVARERHAAQYGPRIAGRIAEEQLPSPQAIINSLVDRFFESSGMTTPEGGSLTGLQRLRQVAYGPGGTARKATGGLMGELGAPLKEKGVGRTERSEGLGYIQSIIGGFIGDETRRRDLLEEDVKRKEQMGSPRQMRVGDIESGLSNEGVYTTAPPGVAGALRGSIAYEESLGPNHGPHDAHQDVDELRTRLAAMEQREALQAPADIAAQQARVNTSGRGRYTSGTATTKLADESGILMERPESTRYGSFEARYSGARRGYDVFGGGPGSPGGPGRGGGEEGGWGGMLGGGAMPVIVVNSAPILVSMAGGGMAGGGAGGVDPYKIQYAKDMSEAPFSSRASGRAQAGKAAKGIRYNQRGVPTIDIVGGGIGARARERVFTAEPDTGGSDYQPVGDARTQTMSAAERNFLATLEKVNKPRGRPAYTAYPDQQREYQPRGDQPVSTSSQSAAERDFLSALSANNPNEHVAEGRLRRQARMQARGGALTPETAFDEERERYLTRQEERVRRETRRARRYDPESLIEEENKYQQEFQDIAGKARIASRSIPRRGFGASLTDLVTGSISGLFASQDRPGGPKLGPLEKQLAAQGRINVELADLNESLKGRAEATREKAVATDLLAGIDQQKNPERWKVVNDRLELAGKAVEGFGKGIVNSTKLIDEQVGIIKANRAGAFAAAAVGSIGSIAIGALTVGIGMAVAQPIIQGVGEGLTAALGPIAERLSGFAGTTGRVQTDVATQLRANNDKLPGTLAGVGVSARLSDAQLAAISGPLGQRAQTINGQQSLAQQFDLYNASQQIDRQQMGGFDRSLFRSTGGVADVQLPFKLFGVQDISIGGQASVAETLNNQLQTLNKPQDIARLQSPLERLPPSPLEDPLGFLKSPDELANKSDAEAKKLIDENNKQLSYLNDGLSKFELVQSDNTQALEEQHRLFAQANANDLGGRLEERGVIVKGVKSIEDVGRFLKDAATSELSPQQLLNQTASERRAQVQLEDAQRAFALDQINPQQSLQLAQQGFGGSGAGTPSARDGINLKGTNPRERKELNRDLDQTQKLYDQINREVDLGNKQATDFVRGTLGNEAGSQFEEALKNSAAYAKQISGIQIGLQTKQAAYSAAQFSYQIDIARRSLKDAKGLLSGVGNSLGAIERQQYNLQRQSQALGLAQSQKQINFQRAVAGFTAPGLTGEERAARIDQAKLEADYAQKQLDIQKKLFGLQGRQFTITASRSVRDLVRQIGLLERGRTLNLETLAAEKKIRALTILAEKENKKVQIFYDAAVQRTGDVLQLAAQLAAATGKAMSQVGKLVLREFADNYTGMIKIINQGVIGANSGRNQGGPGDNGGGQALGKVGMTHGTTEAPFANGVMGEAGGEAYAILRDPKQFLTPMNREGGGSTIQIIISGNKFTTQEEEAAMIRKVTDAVERAQGRKAAMLGAGRVS